jgi:hypothetical protein
VIVTLFGEGEYHRQPARRSETPEEVFEFGFLPGGVKCRMPVHLIPESTSLVIFHTKMNDIGVLYH